MPEKDYDNYVDFGAMLAFYNENKEKLHMPEYGKHTVRKEGFDKWKSHLLSLHNTSRKRNEVPSYLYFAEVLERSLRYITYPEYLGVINKISEEMCVLIRATDTVCFIIGESLKKSNLWVTLLFFEEIIKVISAEELQSKLFFLGTKRIHPISKLRVDRPGSFVLISCDDMTYTGSQIVEKEFLEMTFRCKAPCPQEVYRSITHYVAVPYTTSIAKAKIMSPPRNGLGGLFFENTVIIPTFREQVEEYYKDRPEIIRAIELLCIEKESNVKKTVRRNYLNIKRGHNAFKCIFGFGQTAVYFDHKLADYISVMQRLIAMGSYPPNISHNEIKAKFNKHEAVEPVYSGPLIDGCISGTCYEAFYKQINYTYLGNEMRDNSSIISQIKSARPPKPKRPKKSKKNKPASEN